jgi:hypothetical protein
MNRNLHSLPNPPFRILSQEALLGYIIRVQLPLPGSRSRDHNPHSILHLEPHIISISTLPALRRVLTALLHISRVRIRSEGFDVGGTLENSFKEWFEARETRCYDSQADFYHSPDGEVGGVVEVVAAESEIAEVVDFNTCCCCCT